MPAGGAACVGLWLQAHLFRCIPFIRRGPNTKIHPKVPTYVLRTLRYPSQSSSDYQKTPGGRRATIRTLILVAPNLHGRYRDTSTLPDLLEHLNTLFRLLAGDYQRGKSGAYPSLIKPDPTIEWPHSIPLQLQALQTLHKPKKINEECRVRGRTPERNLKRAHAVKR